MIKTGIAQPLKQGIGSVGHSDTNAFKNFIPELPLFPSRVRRVRVNFA